MSSSQSYYGGSSNIEIISINSNLLREEPSFHINFTYGTSQDINFGKYELEGEALNSDIRIPIKGRGKFVQLNRLEYAEDLPRHEFDFSQLFLDQDGHLRFGAVSDTHCGAEFRNLVVSGLEAGEYTEAVKELLQMGIPSESFVTVDAISHHFTGLFGEATLEEIVGGPLPMKLKTHLSQNSGDVCLRKHVVEALNAN